MGNAPFSLTEDHRDADSCRFTVKGRVNAVNSGVLEKTLERCLRDGRANIVLNMSQVEYLSSAGIRAILCIYKKGQKLGGGLRIANPSDSVKNVIGMAVLDDMLLT